MCDDHGIAEKIFSTPDISKLENNYSGSNKII
jgi:hypothetical protein